MIYLMQAKEIGTEDKSIRAKSQIHEGSRIVAVSACIWYFSWSLCPVAFACAFELLFFPSGTSTSHTIGSFPEANVYFNYILQFSNY